MERMWVMHTDTDGTMWLISQAWISDKSLNGWRQSTDVRQRKHTPLQTAIPSSTFTSSSGKECTFFPRYSRLIWGREGASSWKAQYVLVLVCMFTFESSVLKQTSASAIFRQQRRAAFFTTWPRRKKKKHALQQIRQNWEWLKMHLN